MLHRGTWMILSIGLFWNFSIYVKILNRRHSFSITANILKPFLSFPNQIVWLFDLFFFFFFTFTTSYFVVKDMLVSKKTRVCFQQLPTPPDVDSLFLLFGTPMLGAQGSLNFSTSLAHYFPTKYCFVSLKMYCVHIFSFHCHVYQFVNILMVTY